MRQVFRISAYRRLWSSYALNEFTWGIGTVALAALIYRRTGSALGSTAFFLCSEFLPALISPVAVARLVVHNPRRVMPALYAVEAALFALLAWMTTHFSIAPVLVVALLNGAIALIARVLARTATVEILRPLGLLQEGNAAINMAFSVCFMLGPAAGGVVVAAGGTSAALLANCVLFAAIGLVLATASGLPSAHEEEDDEGSPWQRLSRAAGHVRRDPALRSMIVLQGIVMMFGTISVPIEVVFAEHTLHAGAGGYGAMLSGWGAGAVVGSAAYARWRRLPGGPLMAFSSLAFAIGYGTIAAAPTIEVAVIGSVIGGFGNGISIVAQRTLLQEYTPARWTGLVTSLNESIQWAAPGLGYVLGGVITQTANARAAFAVSAVGLVGLAAVCWWALRPGRIGPPLALPDAPDLPEPEATPVATGHRETLV